MTIYTYIEKQDDIKELSMGRKFNIEICRSSTCLTDEELLMANKLVDITCEYAYAMGHDVDDEFSVDYERLIEFISTKNSHHEIDAIDKDEYIKLIDKLSTMFDDIEFGIYYTSKFETYT